MNNIFSKKVIIFLLILTGLNFIGAVDPFSKMVITSNKAIGKKDQQNEKLVHFSYVDNVRVEFADQSSITANKLFITINNDKTVKDMEKFSKIVFFGNVHLNKKNLKVTAERAEVMVKEQKCTVTGNVKISQHKTGDKKVSVDTVGDRALIDLKTSQVTLLGTRKTPVRTVIDLSEYKKNRP